MERISLILTATGVTAALGFGGVGLAQASHGAADGPNHTCATGESGGRPPSRGPLARSGPLLRAEAVGARP